jgi:hypothetical protein
MSLSPRRARARKKTKQKPKNTVSIQRVCVLTEGKKKKRMPRLDENRKNIKCKQRILRPVW